MTQNSASWWLGIQTDTNEYRVSMLHLQNKQRNRELWDGFIQISFRSKFAFKVKAGKISETWTIKKFQYVFSYLCYFQVCPAPYAENEDMGRKGKIRQSIAYFLSILSNLSRSLRQKVLAECVLIRKWNNNQVSFVESLMFLVRLKYINVYHIH